MATIRRNPQGPLRYAPLIQFGDTIFWGRTEPPTIAAEDDDVTYTVKSHDRHDFTAFTALGSSQLGWVIMERQDQAGNQMRLWPNDWVPGRQIAIPTADSVSRRGII